MLLYIYILNNQLAKKHFEELNFEEGTRISFMGIPSKINLHIDYLVTKCSVHIIIIVQLM